jgi:hypothetical protein
MSQTGTNTASSMLQLESILSTIKEGDRFLTPYERQTLAVTSVINGRIFLPWTEYTLETLFHVPFT